MRILADLNISPRTVEFLRSLRNIRDKATSKGLQDLIAYLSSLPNTD